MIKNEEAQKKLDKIKKSLKLPVLASPMFLISNPDMVIAQAKNGVIGSFPTLNARTIEILDEWFAKISKEVGDKHYYAANLIVHKSNDRVMEDLELIVKYKVPIVITSLGAIEEVYKRVQSYGGIVLHDVINQKFSHKAIEKGADGLIAVCSGAGGHAGKLSPFALCNEIRKWFAGPLVLSGSIAKGSDVLAAMALGCDLAYIGSAFIATKEANAIDEYKNMIVSSGAEDIYYTNYFTGVHGNYLLPSISRAGIELGDIENIEPQKMNFDSNRRQTSKAWKDIWGSGQGIGSIEQILSCKEYIEKISKEYEEAKKRLLSL